MTPVTVATLKGAPSPQMSHFRWGGSTMASVVVLVASQKIKHHSWLQNQNLGDRAFEKGN